MKRCVSCGKDIVDAAVNCVFCGSKQIDLEPLKKTMMGYAAAGRPPAASPTPAPAPPGAAAPAAAVAQASPQPRASKAVSGMAYAQTLAADGAAEAWTPAPEPPRPAPRATTEPPRQAPQHQLHPFEPWARPLGVVMVVFGILLVATAAAP